MNDEIFQNDKIKKNLFVIGAGPSGVEIACKINDIYKNKFDIRIVERSNEILGRNKIFNREEAEKALERRKINVLLNSTVQEISDQKISILDDSEIKDLDQDVVIWTAGVKPNLTYIDEQVIQKDGRILVNENFQIENCVNSFAIGDISIIKGMEDLPLTAQVAMQQGNHLAQISNYSFKKKSFYLLILRIMVK